MVDQTADQSNLLPDFWAAILRPLVTLYRHWLEELLQRNAPFFRT
jgi:hypothetical protein